MEGALALRLTRSEYLALPAEDRAWHEALLAEQNEPIHKPCGQPKRLAFDQSLQDEWTAEEIGKCWACAALKTKSEGSDPDSHWYVHRRPRRKGADDG